MRTIKKNNEKLGRVFLIDNNEDGRKALALMRKTLNRGRYTISVRGRGPNREQYGRNNCNDIPIEHSTQFAVYIYTKPEIVREQERRLEARIRGNIERVYDWEEEVR